MFMKIKGMTPGYSKTVLPEKNIIDLLGMARVKSRHDCKNP
jgi:hypothetical protein